MLTILREFYLKDSTLKTGWLNAAKPSTQED